jgi:hypothetical protein
MNREQVKDLYKKGCNVYLRLFCEKHDFDYEDAIKSWVGNDVGGIVEVCDLFLDMQTIIDDVDFDAPLNELREWYDYCLEANEFGLVTPNYRSWLNGCPRTPKESFDNLRSMKRAFENAIEIEKNLRNGGNY